MTLIIIQISFYLTHIARLLSIAEFIRVLCSSLYSIDTSFRYLNQLCSFNTRTNKNKNYAKNYAHYDIDKQTVDLYAFMKDLKTQK